MTALLDLDANVALSHALALVEEATEALSDIRLESVVGLGLGDVLVRLRTVQRRVEATSSALGRAFADSYEWQGDGARNAAAWLYGARNDSWSDTRSLIERGAVMKEFPVTAEAWRRGAITGLHIDAIARLRRRYPGLQESLSAVDEAISVVAMKCEPREFHQRLKQLCHRVDPDAMDERERTRTISLHVSTMLDGLVRVDGTLDPVLGARLVAALESGRRKVEESAEPPSEPPTESPLDSTSGATARDNRPMSERNVDALRRILDAAGAAAGDLALPLISGERPTVNITVPIEVLLDESSREVGWLERFGVPTTAISGDAARRIACDASLRPFVVDRQGQLVAMLPKVRTIHPALRRAVFMRDVRCRFTGCRERIDEVHHIMFFRHGGPTMLSNLVGLCWHHHHVVHDVGWIIEGDPGGILTFRSPRGRELTSDPPGF
jgi:hypothetical protein